LVNMEKIWILGGVRDLGLEFRGGRGILRPVGVKVNVGHNVLDNKNKRSVYENTFF